jgi:uncharacterized protein YcnI
MKKTSIINVITVALSAIAFSLVNSTSANAHAGAELYGKVAKPNGYGNVFIRIPHADKEKSTVKVEVQIPTGVTAVKPQQVSGWSESSVMDLEGKNVTSVVWSNGNLPDTSFADFGISLKWPNTPGEKVYFKVIQTLNDGSLISWVEIPTAGVDSHSLSKPAPSVTLEDIAKIDNSKSKMIHGDLLVTHDMKKKKFEFLVDLPSTYRNKTVSLNIGDKKIKSIKLDKYGDAYAIISINSNIMVMSDSIFKVTLNNKELLSYSMADNADDHDHKHNDGMSMDSKPAHS